MNLQTIINQPETTIIDVREPYEYDLQHAHGAINIPVGEIMASRKEISTMGLPIIIYCRSGNRSRLAQLLLKANGIKEAYNGGSLSDMLLLQNEKANVL